MVTYFVYRKNITLRKHAFIMTHCIEPGSRLKSTVPTAIVVRQAISHAFLLRFVFLIIVSNNYRLKGSDFEPFSIVTPQLYM